MSIGNAIRQCLIKLHEGAVEVNIAPIYMNELTGGV
jgi:hypothetical protein